MADIIRQSLSPGIFLTSLKTEKFKTSVLSLSMLRPLSRGKAALNALVPQVLCRGTRHFADMAALSARLEELYGARLEPSIRKKGEVQCIGFVMDFIDGAYLPGQPDQLTAAASLLGEVLLNPAGGGGAFAPSYVEAERGNLADQIAAAKNDKRVYASQRLLELMCDGEGYGIDRLGDEDHARAIMPDGLWNHYRDMLAGSRLELFYIGPKTAEKAAAALSGALSALPGRAAVAEVGTDVVRAAAGEVRRFDEVMDVGQGKLAMGARMGVSTADPDYPAALLAATVFGGAATAKLFLHVRERLQLCYYASAHLEGLKGLLIVSSGIDAKDRQAAEDEIMGQWEALCRGDITDEELSAAKLTLINDLRALADQPHRLEDYYLGQKAAGLPFGPDELAGRLEAVTAAEIARAARGASWDSVYFLHGGENK